MNNGIGSKEYFEKYYSSRDWRFYKEFLSNIIALSEPGPILDLGAGCGYLVEACCRWDMKCVGLEGSEHAVKTGHERYPEMDIRHCLLSNPLPFNDNMFATAVMNQVIEHLEPAVADHCISETYRVLKPGGVLLVFSPSRFNKKEQQADSTHINMYSPLELKTLLSSKGFRQITSLDSPLDMLGTNRVSRFIMFLLFRITRWERLSASANCVAFKLK